MAPPGGSQSLKHRLRRAHPLRMSSGVTLSRMADADEAELRRYQDRRLRAVVAVAARRSPFYRKWFRDNSIEPRDIRTIDDLALLPLITRDDLVERPDDFRVYPAGTMWKSHSSGTSGKAVTVYRTPGSSVYELGALERQWGWFGLPRSARRVILRGWAGGTDGAVTREVPGARQLLVSSYNLTADRLDEIVTAIEDFRPDAIEGWPSSITLLAALLAERGRRLPVRALITSSEVMSARQRDLMREVFVGPIVDHYGQTERVALTGNCEAGGHHVFSDYGIVELLPVPGAADRWEIVGTALHNYGFPLLRYRTGDEVGPTPTTPCSCGRAFPQIGSIDGRSEDAFHTLDGRPLPLPATIVDDLVGLREVQIAQLAPGEFEVRVVPGRGYDRVEIAAQIHDNVATYFGAGQQVTIRELESIPRPASGKLKPAVVIGGR